MLTSEELKREFITALDEIEFQYLTFFLFRKPKTKSDTRDRLKNHYLFAIEKGTVIFGFLVGSDLPEDIRIRCLANYVHYFPDGYIYDTMNRL